jgi:hypothetical protein
VGTLARLHGDATGALGTYVSRPKDDEALAERDVTALQVVGELLSRLAAGPHADGCHTDVSGEGSR